MVINGPNAGATGTANGYGFASGNSTVYVANTGNGGAGSPPGNGSGAIGSLVYVAEAGTGSGDAPGKFQVNVAMAADRFATLLRIAGAPARVYLAPGPADLEAIYRDIARVIPCR